MMRGLILSLLMLLNFQLAAFPVDSRVPGGVALIPIQSEQPPQVWLNSQEVLVHPNQSDQVEPWLAVVGIPLSAQAGEMKVKVQSGAKAWTQAFQIADKHYPEQRIQIKNKRMVDPNPDDLKRINRESKHLKQVLATWSRTQPQLEFALPVDGRLSSPFGLRRFFNDQPRKPHSGLDIAASRGTPIQTPADGTVIDSGNYFFNGNTVLIDHGQGLISGYFHLDETRVKTGDIIKAGDILGTVGDTGRVTGPHLHWNIYLNGAKIDPALFVSTAIKALQERGKQP